MEDSTKKYLTTIRIESETLSMTLEEAYGSVEPINRPEDFDALRKIANEEREARWLKKLQK